MISIEDKTILEELLEQSEEQAKEHKIEKAYHLISLEEWDTADELFDEVLKAEPDNSDALMGKRIVERQREIVRRMEVLGARAYKIASQRQPEAEKPFRSRMALWVVLIIVLIGAGVAAAFASGAVHFKWNLRPIETPAPVYTAEPAPEETKPPIIIPSFDVPDTTDTPETPKPTQSDSGDDEPDTPSTAKPSKDPAATKAPSTPKPSKTPTPEPPAQTPEPPKPPEPDM